MAKISCAVFQRYLCDSLMCKDRRGGGWRLDGVRPCDGREVEASKTLRSDAAWQGSNLARLCVPDLSWLWSQFEQMAGEDAFPACDAAVLAFGSPLMTSI